MASWNRSRELAQVVDIARLYFEEGKTQKDISECLGIPQATISRLLQRASDEGIVRHIISPPRLFGLQTEVLKKLRSKGIREVRVVLGTSSMEDKKNIENPDKNTANLGAHGAEYLWDLLSQHTGEQVTIGMACGDTLAALVRHFVNYLQDDFSARKELQNKTIRLYPLNLFWERELESTIYPPALVVAFGTQLTALGCKVHAFVPQPPIDFYEAYDTIFCTIDKNKCKQPADQKQVHKQIHKYIYYLQKQIDGYVEYLNQAKNADIFLLGIGAYINDEKYMHVLKESYNYNNDKKAICVLNESSNESDGKSIDLENESEEKKFLDLETVAGEINYQPFTYDGEFYTLRRFLTVTAKDLIAIAGNPAKKVIAVAGGESKKSAVLASLKCNPPYNVLITDECVGQHLYDTL